MLPIIIINIKAFFFSFFLSVFGQMLVFLSDFPHHSPFTDQQHCAISSSKGWMGLFIPGALTSLCRKIPQISNYFQIYVGCKWCNLTDLENILNNFAAFLTRPSQPENGINE